MKNAPIKHKNCPIYLHTVYTNKQQVTQKTQYYLLISILQKLVQKMLIHSIFFSKRI